MSLIFRMLWVWWRARTKTTLNSAKQASIIRMRVLPNDLDVFLHMNNSRYLSIMDLGRLDILTRIGQTHLMMTKKWLFLVAASRMQYLKPLNLLDQYELYTRIVCWDEKWFYLEQAFIKNQQQVAMGWVKGIIRGPHGNISTAQFFSALNLLPETPDLPPADFQQWISLEQRKNSTSNDVR